MHKSDSRQKEILKILEQILKKIRRNPVNPDQLIELVCESAFQKKAEDIVVMKILSGRPKDLEDVEAILIAQASAFDEQRTRQLLGRLQEALDQSDLVPTFDRCRARAGE